MFDSHRIVEMVGRFGGGGGGGSFGGLLGGSKV